ncbi:hypothetical protein SJZ82_06915 [Serratia marcescens]|uniref:hypothetical protein n=1 Tax=Serratia marcescens TaxID=615 RepID=UPI0029DD1519|nr:hypothetical protein [Serratia marcescens]MDX6800910.1 hypothetical protein [Serratia marcescens]
MITVKRYNPDAAMSISREHAWMRETPEGGHVEYGDYASLFAQFESVKAERDAQQKRADALAVENQALKDVFVPGEAVVNFLSIALRRTKYDYINLPDVALAFKMSLPETPTTDAALAAIEARGVEKAAEALDALSAQSASATTQANFRAAAVYLRTAVIPAIGEAK